MATKVFGASDDLVELEGDVTGEVNYLHDDDDEGCLLAFDDGTLLRVKYGKPQGAIWEVTLVQKGGLFDRIETCLNEDADIYSDVAHFKDGMKRCFAATCWELVK